MQNLLSKFNIEATSDQKFCMSTFNANQYRLGIQVTGYSCEGRTKLSVEHTKAPIAYQPLPVEVDSFSLCLQHIRHTDGVFSFP